MLQEHCQTREWEDCSYIIFADMLILLGSGGRERRLGTSHFSTIDNKVLCVVILKEYNEMTSAD